MIQKYDLFSFNQMGFKISTIPFQRREKEYIFCSKVKDFVMPNGKGRIDREDCLILRTIDNGYLFCCIDLMVKSQKEY